MDPIRLANTITGGDDTTKTWKSKHQTRVKKKNNNQTPLSDENDNRGKIARRARRAALDNELQTTRYRL